MTNSQKTHAWIQDQEKKGERERELGKSLFLFGRPGCQGRSLVKMRIVGNLGGGLVELGVGKSLDGRYR